MSGLCLESKKMHNNLPIHPHACFNKNQNNNMSRKQMKIAKQSSTTSLSSSKHHDQQYHNAKNKSIMTLILNPFLEVNRNTMAERTRHARLVLAMCA